MNWRRLNVNKIREHLLCDEFLRPYTTWTCELLHLPSVTVSQEYVQSIMNDVHDDQLEDMIRNVGVESFAKAHGYKSMSSDVLINGSTNFTRLSAVLRLMNSKTINRWTDKSFTGLWH